MASLWKQGMSDDIAMSSTEVDLPLDAPAYVPDAWTWRGEWIVDKEKEEYYFFGPKDPNQELKYMLVNLNATIKATGPVYSASPLLVRTEVHDQRCANYFDDRWIVPETTTEKTFFSAPESNMLTFSTRRSIRFYGETTVRFKVSLEQNGSSISILKNYTYCNMFLIC